MTNDEKLKTILIIIQKTGYKNVWIYVYIDI